MNGIARLTLNSLIPCYYGYFETHEVFDKSQKKTFLTEKFIPMKKFLENEETLELK